MNTDIEPPSAEVDLPRPRPLTGGVVMSGTSRATVAVTGAVAGIFVARLLGPSGTGGYAIALSFIALLTVASTLGIEHGIAYYVSARRWSALSAHRDAQRLAVLFGIVGASLGMLARLAVPSAFGGLSVATTAVAAFALPFALSWFYFSFVALAVDHYEAYALPPAMQSTLALVFVAVLSALYGLPGAVVGLLSSHVVTAVAASAAARRILSSATPVNQPTHELAQLRRAIAFGIKGYASNALQFINFRLDLFILASVATAAELGNYAIAVSVTSVMWLLPLALSDVLFPRVAALSANAGQDGERMRAFVETKSLRHTVVVVVFASAVLALALEFLVVPVYGVAFRSAVNLGLILLPGVALLGLAGPMASTIVGRGHPGYSLIITLIVTPLTVLLYVLLIPTLHADGAALASSISYAMSFLLVTAFYGRVIGEPVTRRLIPTRAEIADYRALTPAILTWAGNLRGRRERSER